MTYEQRRIDRAYNTLLARACSALTGLAIAFNQRRIDVAAISDEGDIILFQDEAKGVQLTLSEARTGYRALMETPLGDDEMTEAMASAITPLVEISDSYLDAANENDVLVRDGAGEPVLSVADVLAARRASKPISYREALTIDQPLAA